MVARVTGRHGAKVCVIALLAIYTIMDGRSALLICCSKKEAQEVRRRAKLDRRSTSGYVLLIVLEYIAFDERLLSLLERIRPLHELRKHTPVARHGGPRTAMLIRCSKEEANQIRTAAKRRSTTISAFVLYALHGAWEVQDRIGKKKSTSRAQPEAPKQPGSLQPIPWRTPLM